MIKKEWSKSFEMDIRSWKGVWIQILTWCLALYFTNTEFFNEWIKELVSEKVAILIIMVLAYFWKKFLTNYSKK